MRVRVLERFVVVLTACVVAFLGGGVLTVTLLFPGGIRDGIPEGAVENEVAMAEWRALTWPEVEAPEFPESHVESAPGETTPAASDTKKSPGDTKSSRPRRNRASRPEGLPPPKPGTRVYPLRRIPAYLRRRFETAEGLKRVVQRGGGRFVRTKSGKQAYEITWLDPKSELASLLRLQAGDRVIAVNDRPLGTSPESGRVLYEALRGETRFWIRIERQGREFVIPVEAPR